MRFFQYIAALSFGTLLLFGTPLFVHAAGEVVEPLQNPLAKTVSLDKPVQSVSKMVINVIFSLTGSAALIMYVVAGFFWMTAMGNSKQVDKAKHIFIWASVGVVVMFSSYIILNFLFGSLS